MIHISLSAAPFFILANAACSTGYPLIHSTTSSHKITGVALMTIGVLSAVEGLGLVCLQIGMSGQDTYGQTMSVLDQSTRLIQTISPYLTGRQPNTLYLSTPSTEDPNGALNPMDPKSGFLSLLFRTRLSYAVVSSPQEACATIQKTVEKIGTLLDALVIGVHGSPPALLFPIPWNTDSLIPGNCFDHLKPSANIILHACSADGFTDSGKLNIADHFRNLSNRTVIACPDDIYPMLYAIFISHSQEITATFNQLSHESFVKMVIGALSIQEFQFWNAQAMRYLLKTYGDIANTVFSVTASAGLIAKEALTTLGYNPNTADRWVRAVVKPLLIASYHTQYRFEELASRASSDRFIYRWGKQGAKALEQAILKTIGYMAFCWYSQKATIPQ